MTDPQPEHPRSLDVHVPPRPVREDVSVVISTLGRSILETSLFYLSTGTVWPSAVIVVDQGRNEAIERMLEQLAHLGIRSCYIPSAQKGKAAGLNRGLERVDTRFVCVTDDDCFVAARWMEHMSDRLRREPDSILTGRVELAGDEDAEFCTVTHTEDRLYTKPQLRTRPFIGGNFGLSMENVAKIGPFDEHPCLMYAEDSDYGHRALRCGIPIIYDPKVLVHHYHWRDAGQRISRYGDYARSQGGFYGTHLRKGDPLILVQSARDLLRSPVRWARGILRGDRELAENGRASTLNLLPGIVAGLRRRSDRDAPA